MFPLGFEPYLIGGIVVGLGVSLTYIMTGIHAGQSGFLQLRYLGYRKEHTFRRIPIWLSVTGV